MQVSINGEAFTASAGETLISILAEYGVTGDRVAVMVNDEVVPRARRGERSVVDGDQIEILTFAGGG